MIIAAAVVAALIRMPASCRLGRRDLEAMFLLGGIADAWGLGGLADASCWCEASPQNPSCKAAFSATTVESLHFAKYIDSCRHIRQYQQM